MKARINMRFKIQGTEKRPRTAPKALGTLLVAVSLLAGCTKPLPDDGANATLKRFDDLRADRYTEIGLVGGNPITKDLRANVYNTIGLNDPAGTGDTTPQAMLDKVDLDQLKKQYDVLGTWKNGPRQWALDWVEVMVGEQREFNGLKARWVGVLNIPKGVDLNKEGATAYKPTTFERKTQFGFNKGKPVFILDDPDGNTWVMKSSSLIVDPTNTHDKLEKLGERLKAAPGWKFRVAVLEQDLVLKPESGVAPIVQDELGNTYDKTGPGLSNFKP
jgi:hypothetical protein